MSWVVAMLSVALVGELGRRARPAARRARLLASGEVVGDAELGRIGSRPRRTVAVDRAVAQAGTIVLSLAFGAIVMGPVGALLLAGVVGLAGPMIRRVDARRRAAATSSAVPDLVDLFLVAASAGRPVAGSLLVVASRAPPAVAPALRSARDRFRRGQALVECLGQLGAELGPAGEPLTGALQQAAATGAPLVPLLEGVAAAARDARRRRAQEVARRLPVTMLLPLVACILPAAILLAVVPVLLVSVASLSP